MVHEIQTEYPKFPCTQCGACCRRAGEMKGFPEPLNEDGSCVHLQDDNRCGIYKDRPIVCRVNGLFEHIAPDMSIEQWHKMNIDACNKMIHEDELSEEYLIPNS